MADEILVPPDSIYGTKTIILPRSAGLASILGVRITGSLLHTSIPVHIDLSLGNSPAHDGNPIRSSYDSQWNIVLADENWMPGLPAQTPLDVSIRVWFFGAPVGSRLKLSMQGASTTDGSPVFNPDVGGVDGEEGSESYSLVLTDSIEIGTYEVVSWVDWYRINPR